MRREERRRHLCSLDRSLCIVEKVKIYLDSPPPVLGRPAIAPRPDTPRHLITFHSGFPYSLAAERLERQARATGWFTGIDVFHPGVNHPAMLAFVADHGEFVRRNSRGYGYWRWKPLLVKAMLESLPEGAHLYYVDAGCELSRFGSVRFAALDHELAARGVLCFTTEFLDAGWCKREAVEAVFGAWNETVMSSRQIQGTWFGLRNVASVRDCIAEWSALAIQGELITDSYDPSRQHPEFLEHRHDQALWSLVLKKNGIQPLPQEDCFEKWLYVRNSWVLLVPVHGLRSRGGRSWINAIVAASTEKSCLNNLRAPSMLLRVQFTLSRFRKRTIDTVSRMYTGLARLRTGRPT